MREFLAARMGSLTAKLILSIFGSEEKGCLKEGSNLFINAHIGVASCIATNNCGIFLHFRALRLRKGPKTALPITISYPGIM